MKYVSRCSLYYRKFLKIFCKIAQLYSEIEKTVSMDPMVAIVFKERKGLAFNLVISLFSFQRVYGKGTVRLD
jgi:hypothetical protein